MRRGVYDPYRPTPAPTSVYGGPLPTSSTPTTPSSTEQISDLLNNPEGMQPAQNSAPQSLLPQPVVSPIPIQEDRQLHVLLQGG